MLSPTERQKIIALINREVVPAIGCTEPVAVSLATARAVETLGTRPDRIKVYLSANVLKNAMGVGIPGTDMIGLPIAIALGAVVGKSDYRLEVLKDLTPETLEEGKQLVNSKCIEILLKNGIEEKLYIEVLASKGDATATVIISGQHTNICYVEKNGTVLSDNRKPGETERDEDTPELNMRKVYDFATTAPVDEIRFILEAARLNKAAAVTSFDHHYGHALGQTLTGAYQKQVMGDSIFSHILAYTSAACDARMAGAMVPVMSNSGSGNQGISATVPVVIYAEETHQSEEKLIRALILSHLTAIYIKTYLGRLSALCGCVVAGTGSSCGITYLMGGSYEQITFAVKNMAANLTGMICDGAKPSCALKVGSGIATAVFSAMLAMEGKTVSALEGIIDEDVDQCVRNLAKIGTQGMEETDKLVLAIMTTKKC